MPSSTISICAIALRKSRVRLGRGVTLIEILVVLLIVGIAIGAVLAGTGRMASARLKQSSALITGAIRVAYARANSTSKPVRLVFDMENNTLQLEQSEGMMLVQSGDKTGTGGAAAANGSEEAAIAENKRILEGPTAPRSRFRAIEESAMHSGDAQKNGARKLPSGITIRGVQSTHDDAQRTDGKAYLYFWPGGQTEQCNIQVAIGETPTDDQIMTLVVAPLTGRVKVLPGPKALERFGDERDQQEREAPGGL
jgi:general secretion pathway protein H